ncbi:hypothetical protein VOLCADRAFT_87363 [Volvox carteri f. nagariensis]|uniref:Uncharacterized protein n=1 Tax=Volvox carteri f. nagariensis TaxID=3068 RepID=D8TL57_VOLCA|nr:uncharacterized protein VOLCADRAFT_87363 [Volvox carteri f. nagariensis]EFJ51682.1 hypothetical protein VOLCADRAFT_87363 [Volvox carteri f. nagariensis]|eukprot:XP_002947092.1 hypothetical protein VOLCADRAFT_87363 [Volvox carteri f. nagariensis]
MVITRNGRGRNRAVLLRQCVGLGRRRESATLNPTLAYYQSWVYREAGLRGYRAANGPPIGATLQRCWSKVDAIPSPSGVDAACGKVTTGRTQSGRASINLRATSAQLAQQSGLRSDGNGQTALKAPLHSTRARGGHRGAAARAAPSATHMYDTTSTHNGGWGHLLVATPPAALAALKACLSESFKVTCSRSERIFVSINDIHAQANIQHEGRPHAPDQGHLQWQWWRWRLPIRPSLERFEE